MNKNSQRKQALEAVGASFEDLRLFYLAMDCNHAVLTMSAGVYATLVLAVIDYLFLKLSPVFFQLMIYRVGFVGISLICMRTIQRLAGPRGTGILDQLVMWWWLLLGTLLILVDISRPSGYTQNQSLYILLVFGGHTVVMTRFFSRFVPTVLISLADILILVFVKTGLSTPALVMIVMTLGVTHVVGWLVGKSTTEYRFRQYLAARSEEKARRELELLAITDELTGFYNRRYFNEAMEREFKRFTRQGQSFCLVLLDFDHFKQLNDRYGHVAGDDVLRRFAGMARQNSRAMDAIARLGGDEFVILCPDTKQAEAFELTTRLVALTNALMPAGMAEKTGLGISAGVAEVSAGDASSDQMLIRADLALYQAKQQGRSRVVLFNPDFQMEDEKLSRQVDVDQENAS